MGGIYTICRLCQRSLQSYPQKQPLMRKVFFIPMNDGVEIETCMDCHRRLRWYFKDLPEDFLERGDES